MPLETPKLSPELTLDPILEHARADAQARNLPYAGTVSPLDAWTLASTGQAVLVDVRSPEELNFVGRIPGSLHVPWASGTALTRNPRFVRELDARLGARDKPVLLLCRSGKRSALAAEAAAKAGIAFAFSVQEGFEGELDEKQQRGQLNGWRQRGLPWVQD